MSFSLPGFPRDPWTRPPPVVDPDLPSTSDDGLFGLAHRPEEARLLVFPVPYDATVSGAEGTRRAPEIVVAASSEIDLADGLFGEPWKQGLASLGVCSEIAELSKASAQKAAEARRGDLGAREAVDAAGHRLWEFIEQTCRRIWDGQRSVIVLGGEHGISYGAIRAAAAREPGLGVLQVDAHADLRRAYEGFETSHASVMRRVLEEQKVARLVQVGARDLSVEEREVIRSSGSRLISYEDDLLAARQADGEAFAAIADEIVGALPEKVWVSFDVDGLDPSLCPGTGTPVPGGLSWRESRLLLSRLQRSGRSVIGADLVEVGTSRWDALVAAKVLYQLAGMILGETRRNPRSA